MVLKGRTRMERGRERDRERLQEMEEEGLRVERPGQEVLGVWAKMRNGGQPVFQHHSSSLRCIKTCRCISASSTPRWS